MKNYMDFGNCKRGRWRQYLYLDTDDVLLTSIITRDLIRVEFEEMMGRDNEQYHLIFVKVHHKDVGRFLTALEELKKKMLICGYRDYETHGEELMTELEDLIREDLKGKGHISLPSGEKVVPVFES